MRGLPSCGELARGADGDLLGLGLLGGGRVLLEDLIQLLVDLLAGHLAAVVEPRDRHLSAHRALPGDDPERGTVVHGVGDVVARDVLHDHIDRAAVLELMDQRVQAVQPVEDLPGVPDVDIHVLAVLLPKEPDDPAVEILVLGHEKDDVALTMIFPQVFSPYFFI